MLKVKTAGTAIGAALAASASAGVTATADDCYADWGVAGEVVRREKLLTVEQLAATAAADLAGSIVKSTLCKNDGGYAYQLVVRDRDGHLKSAVVPAEAAKKP